MNRGELESELKRIHVDLDGWLPVLHCDICDTRWEPFVATVGEHAPTARFDYWVCPNRCNVDLQPQAAARTVTPRHVVINDVPGMVFGDEDLVDFERYVHSMDATEVWNR